MELTREQGDENYRIMSILRTIPSTDAYRLDVEIYETLDIHSKLLVIVHEINFVE